MRLSRLFETSPCPLSFEFFPPKTEKGDKKLFESVLPELAALKPDYVSVTYGAGGSTQTKTGAMIARIQEDFQLVAMAHLTTVGSSADDISNILDLYAKAGVENILALRGDPPADANSYEPHPDGYANATELIKHLKKDGRFGIGSAAYPDGHVEANSKQQDWDYLIQKFQLGADCSITQCFFDPSAYAEMLNYVHARVPDARIIPGILPPLNLKSLESFCERCGAHLPESLKTAMQEHIDDDAAAYNFGIQFCINFCIELLEVGAPGLHLYTINKAEAVRDIVNGLRERGYFQK